MTPRANIVPAMKFGIFHELSVGKPWTPTSESEVYHNALDQIVLADELGLRSDVGRGAPFPRGVLSLLSAGGVSRCGGRRRPRTFGWGTGSIDGACRRSTTRRAAPNAPPRWTSSRRDGSSLVPDVPPHGQSSAASGCEPDHDERDVDGVRRRDPEDVDRRSASAGMASTSRCRPRNIIPKPYQKPHPPMWVAVTSPETAIQAAERGIGCLGVSIGTQASSRSASRTTAA